MQSTVTEQICLWRWKPVTKDMKKSSFKGYEQICSADPSFLLLMIHFAVSFMYLKGKVFPQILYVGESGAGRQSVRVLSPPFCL